MAVSHLELDVDWLSGAVGHPRVRGRRRPAPAGRGRAGRDSPGGPAPSTLALALIAVVGVSVGLVLGLVGNPFSSADEPVASLAAGSRERGVVAGDGAAPTTGEPTSATAAADRLWAAWRSADRDGARVVASDAVVSTLFTRSTRAPNLAAQPCRAVAAETTCVHAGRGMTVTFVARADGAGHYRVLVVRIDQE